MGMGKTMAVCIAGMHRSGTSMVARLLRICGLDLGSEKDFLPAAADNPEGFWEHRAFLRLNDRLLARLGGPWWQLPAFRPGWEHDPGLDDLRRQALELTRTFKASPLWGWKDPRNCLTLPFWKQIIPQLQVIVCVRNPLEAALSLGRRHGMPLAQGLPLWSAHYEYLLAAAVPEQRLVTHYISYFHDPQIELRRLLDAVGLAVPEHTLASACATIAPELRHGKITAAMLELAQRQPERIGARIEASLLALYEALAAEAGPVYRAAEASEAAACDPQTLALPIDHADRRADRGSGSHTPPRARFTSWVAQGYGTLLRRLGL